MGFLSSITEMVGNFFGAGEADSADALANESIGLSRELAALSREQWDRYKKLYGPLEEQAIKDVSGTAYEDEAKQRLDTLEGQDQAVVGDLDERLTGLEDEYRLDPEAEAERAGTDVQQAYGRGRSIALRQAGKYGINPNSGAFTTMAGRSTLDEAKADAFARNTSRFNAGETNFNRGLGIYGMRSDLGGRKLALNEATFNRRMSIPETVLNRRLAVGNMGRGLPASAMSGLSSSAGDMMRGSEAYGEAAANRAAFGMKLVGAGAAGFGGGGWAGAGKVLGMADGGEIVGPGTETSDSVPIDASDGEFVMNADAVRHFGLSKLEKMNEVGLKMREKRGYGMRKPSFANGGYVDAEVVRQTGSPALTVKKKNEYDSENADKQVSGEEAPSWPDWLRDRGYGLDGRGHVYQVN